MTATTIIIHDVIQNGVSISRIGIPLGADIQTILRGLYCDGHISGCPKDSVRLEVDEDEVPLTMHVTAPGHPRLTLVSQVNPFENRSTNNQ